LVFILTILDTIGVLFTWNYRQDMFKLAVGLNRWSFRVGAYASLMQNEYPPRDLAQDGVKSCIM
jgi:hypothetical protein